MDSRQVALEAAEKDFLENNEEQRSRWFGTFASRARLGKMCKRVIDFGRMHYIRNELHMRARLVRFIDDSVTPENVLLLAY